MFTERTDKVFRQILAFVYLSADITYPAFFIGFRFWLHIVLIVRVCHRFDIRKPVSYTHLESMVAKGEAVWVETESKPTIQLTKPWSPKGMFYR